MREQPSSPRVYTTCTSQRDQKDQPAFKLLPGLCCASLSLSPLYIYMRVCVLLHYIGGPPSRGNLSPLHFVVDVVVVI